MFLFLWGFCFGWGQIMCIVLYKDICFGEKYIIKGSWNFIEFQSRVLEIRVQCKESFYTIGDILVRIKRSKRRSYMFFQRIRNLSRRKNKFKGLEGRVVRQIQEEQGVVFGAERLYKRWVGMGEDGRSVERRRKLEEGFEYGVL